MKATASLAALIVLAALPTAVLATSYGYLDRPDETNLNSRAALAHDTYVRGLGWAWGDVRFKADPGTGPSGERQAREGPDRRDLTPGRQPDSGATPPRGARPKISMPVAALDLRGRQSAL